MVELIQQPWPWYVAGPLIALVMALLLLFGRRFGVSSNFETLCAIGGAGKVSDYFKIDWKKNIWSLVFVAGAIIGGFIGGNLLMPNQEVDIADDTVVVLESYGFVEPGKEFLPSEVFSAEEITWKGWLMLILGGFLVGFGSRYAGGCTSGHAISGLSNLQLPSLIAVIGFFIGGLTVTWLIFPILF